MNYKTREQLMAEWDEKYLYGTKVPLENVDMLVWRAMRYWEYQRILAEIEEEEKEMNSDGTGMG